MSSGSVHVPDTLQAMKEGSFPGSFSPDRTLFSFPRLRYRSNRGPFLLWQIFVRLLHNDNAESNPLSADSDGMAAVAMEDDMLRQGAGAAPVRDYVAEIYVEASQEGGKIREAIPTSVHEGKNLGKKNATNCLTQALRDALGKYNAHLRKYGNVPDAESNPLSADSDSAESAGTSDGTSRVLIVGPGATPDELGAALNFVDPPATRLPLPMLVKADGSTARSRLTPAQLQAGVTVQRKYNGVRLVAHLLADSDGSVSLYSRTGSTYPGLVSVKAELKDVLDVAAAKAKALAAKGDESVRGPPFLDGELYRHGMTLQQVSGQARKTKDADQLEYHVYDVFFPEAIAAGHNMPSRDRQEFLRALFAELDGHTGPAVQQASPIGSSHPAQPQHPHVVAVETLPARSNEEVNALAERFLEEGYEGAIVRKDDSPYVYGTNNYHATSLVKVKPIFDEEFPVVGYAQGTKGKDVGAIIWECEVPNAPDPGDRRFTVTPKNLTYGERYRLFACMSQVVGVTADGAPLTRFTRDFLGQPLTVEFAEKAADTGKPQRAKALVFRTYEGGPDRDPVRRALEECLEC